MVLLPCVELPSEALQLGPARVRSVVQHLVLVVGMLGGAGRP
jgi:hypothetical protein